MEFAYGQSVFRDRRQPKTDPYDPTHQISGTWEDPLDTIMIDGAFVASSSSSGVPDAARMQFVTYKSLYCQPSADVRPGDRIRVGDVAYEVNAVPSADINPFTGWQPVMEIPLKVADG